MKSNRIVKGLSARGLATTAKGYAGMIGGIGLMVLLFVLTSVSSAVAQPTIQFTFPATRATIPANFSNVVTIAISNPNNTNGLAVSTNHMTVDINGFYHLDPVTLNVSGLPPGATNYTITDPNGVILTSNGMIFSAVGNASTNINHTGYETNGYHTNLLLNIYCTNVAEGVYTFNLNAGGDGSTTPGFPTNTIPLVLQAAHLWIGATNDAVESSFNLTENWTNATSWLGGVPGTNDDVVFGDYGAQTNTTFFASGGFAITNVFIGTNTSVASIRFAPSSYISTNATNAFFYTIQLATNATLKLTGTNGFSLLRDYIGEFGIVGATAPLGYAGVDSPMGVYFFGTNAGIVVSNNAANFSMLVGNAQQPTLNMSNLDSFVSVVSQMGIGEYQLYPNYAGLNNAYNGTAFDTNQYNGRPARFICNIYLARTNSIFAGYKDPNNYTTENRTYALSWQDSEQQGVGSSTSDYFYLGVSNRFFMDSVCFVRANHATGNGTTAGLRFGFLNSGAFFRSTNFAIGNPTNYASHDPTNRMSVFTMSDDGGTTNGASSNVKATIDFSANQGLVDILADRLYVARDRTVIASNQAPNVQGDLTIGKGNVDVNTAFFGYQEHNGKMDWTTLYYPIDQAYLNYCRGTLTVTNGGTVRVNKTLTLGYTADTNPYNSAQQFNTWGQITVDANSTLAASNIVCDGGLNYYDSQGDNNGRNNTITLNQGTLIVSNSIGGPGFAVGAVAPGNANGLPLDTLTTSSSASGSSTIVLFVAAGKTNIFVRTLANNGTSPTIIKLGAPPTGVSSYPATLPIISFVSAQPFMAADTTAMGAGTNGYILVDNANNLITLYLTTQAPKNLVWVGGDPAGPSTWDLTRTNWVPVGGGSVTNFSLGDIATFNDGSVYTNITVTTVVVPNQSPTNTGVTITNMTSQYTFNASGAGAIAGTFQMLKTGTNLVTINAPEGGPLTIAAGSVAVGGSGVVGSTTLLSNNCSLVVSNTGTVGGNLTSTGAVLVLAGGNINGAITIGGGSVDNNGTISLTPVTSVFNMAGNSVFTNEVNGLINLGTSGSSLINVGCTFANFGTINASGYGAAGGVLTCYGLFFGNGLFYDSVGGTSVSPAPGRLALSSNPGTVPPTTAAMLSPGATPNNSIGSMHIGGRLDTSGNNPQADAGTVLIEIDQSHVPVTNDNLVCDKWNTIAGNILMTNWNGYSFSSGQIFHVFVNTLSGYPNSVDTPTIWPVMWPTMPGNGLQWNLSRIQTWGDIMVTNSSMIWDGNYSTSWDTNGVSTSWKSPNTVYANNQGAVFDERATSYTVTLTGTVAPAGFNLVTNPAGPANTYFTNPPSFMPGIIVSNNAHPYLFVAGPSSSQYVVSTNNTGTNSYFGTINGMTSLYKTGSGLLTILLTNSYTGGTIIDGGTLAFTNPLALGVDAAQRYQYSSIVMDNNATLKYFGTNNAQLTTSGNRSLLINSGGATIEVSNTATVFNLDYQILGNGALTKTGSGILQLSSSVNFYAGPTYVNAGVLLMTAQAAGSNYISLANNTTLQVTNSYTFSNTVQVAGSTATVMELGAGTGGSKIIDNGSWTGSGMVTISNALGSVFTFNGPLSNYSGTISFGPSAGGYVFNSGTNKNTCLGSTGTVFDLGTGSATLTNFNGGGLTYDLGGLSGGVATILAGRWTNNVLTNATTTYSIGAAGINTVFSGVIADGVSGGTVSVIKVGPGSLLLNGASTFSGGTTVSNGILGGTGSVAGALTVAPGGTLAPGPSPGTSVGTFTVGGNVVLNGTVLIGINRSAPTTNDQLSATGTITANSGSALVVTNLGPNLINGTKFPLFNKGVSGTGFSSVTLPAPGTYNWANNIASDGSITLSGGGISTNAPVVTNSYSASNGTLTLNWPSTNSGWELMSNSVSLTSTGMWFQVFGSTTTNKMILSVDPSKTNVFFRLQLP